MRDDIQLQIELFRQRLEWERQQAREVGALGRAMREMAAEMRVSAHSGVEEIVEGMLRAHPIATLF